jgi:hypothetical protein
VPIRVPTFFSGRKGLRGVAGALEANSVTAYRGALGFRTGEGSERTRAALQCFLGRCRLEPIDALAPLDFRCRPLSRLDQPEVEQPVRQPDAEAAQQGCGFFEEAVKRRPGRIVTLRQKTRLLADSRRKN